MNSPRTDPPLWKLTLAFASVYLIWGSTYLAIRFTIETVPPFSMAAIRFLFAGVILYAIARRGAPRPTRRDWSSALIVGTLLIGGGNGGVVWAIQWLPSGLAAVIIATVALWMVLIDWVTGGSERPSLSLMLGLLWGLLGVALLVGSDQVGAQNREGLIGAAALLGASLSWAAGSIYARRAKFPDSPWMTTAMHMLAGGVILTVMAIVAGEPEQIDIGNISAKSAVSLFYLTIFGALVGYSAYIWLLGVTTPARASTYAYVNPAVAVFLGWLFADELIGLRSGVAIAMILSAVVVVTLKGGRPNRAIQPASASSQRE